MPKTIPLVSELEWKATGTDSLTVESMIYSRDRVNGWLKDCYWVAARGVTAWFTEACRQKLLAAMDNFGKVEDPEHWKQIYSIANGPSSPHAKALLELRQRIESLEGKK